MPLGELGTEGLPLFGRAPRGPAPWDLDHVHAPLARTSDPVPSHIAAEVAFADARKQNPMIVACLRGMGSRGGTAHEIAAALGHGWTNVIVSRRISALRQAGLVYSFDGEEGRPLAERPFNGSIACTVHVACELGLPIGRPPEVEELKKAS